MTVHEEPTDANEQTESQADPAADETAEQAVTAPPVEARAPRPPRPPQGQGIPRSEDLAMVMTGMLLRPRPRRTGWFRRLTGRGSAPGE